MSPVCGYALKLILPRSCTSVLSALRFLITLLAFSDHQRISNHIRPQPSSALDHRWLPSYSRPLITASGSSSSIPAPRHSDRAGLLQPLPGAPPCCLQAPLPGGLRRHSNTPCGCSLRGSRGCQPTLTVLPIRAGGPVKRQRPCLCAGPAHQRHIETPGQEDPRGRHQQGRDISDVSVAATQYYASV